MFAVNGVSVVMDVVVLGDIALNNLYIERMDDLTVRRKQLLHRARYRGTRENDLLFGHFAEQYVQTWDAHQMDQFDALLMCPDQDIYAWMTGVQDFPADLDGDVLRQLKEFVEYEKSKTRKT